MRVKLWYLLLNHPVTVRSVFPFLSPFVNQVLTISCYCVPFQNFSLTIEGPGVFLDVFCVFLVYILTLIPSFFLSCKEGGD